MFTLHLPAGFPTVLLSSWLTIALLSIVVCGTGLLVVRWLGGSSLPVAHAILMAAVLTTVIAPLTLAGSWTVDWSPIRLVAIATNVAVPPGGGDAVSTRPLDTTRSARAVPVVSSAPPAASGPFAPQESAAMPLSMPAMSDAPGSIIESAETVHVLDSLPNAGSSGPNHGWNAVRIVQWVVVAIWLSGASYHLYWLFCGLGRVRQFERTIQPETDPDLIQITAEVAQHLGMSHSPPLGRSSGLDVPMSLGLFRPQVILPYETAAHAWSSETWRPLLVHELAHIHRRDHIVGLFQRLAAALYWWNPLLHAASRELSLVREQICDDLATSAETVGVLSQRRNYATLLVDLAERAAQRTVDRLGLVSALAAWNGPGDDLTRRIQRLLDP